MKKTITIILFFVVFKFGDAQIIHFSQFYSTPMTIAPSFAGPEKGGRVAINYRDQWPSIPGVYRTIAAGVDHYFPRANSGVGLLFIRDAAGEGNLGLTEGGFLYSYNFKVSQKRSNKSKEWFIRPGIHFKYSQRSIDFEKLTFGDQLRDPSKPTGTAVPFKKKPYIDFAASAMAYSELYWAGISVDHLLRPNQSLYGLDSRLHMKFSLFGGAKVLLNSRKRRVRYNREPESITFALNYQYWDKFDQLDLGAYWTHDPLILGAWFRGIPVADRTDKSFNNLDAIIVMVGFKITRNLKIGYSYDMTIIKNLFSHTGGSHEVSLVYEFNKNLGKNQKHSIIPCPGI